MESQDEDQKKINDILNKIEPTIKSGNLEGFKDLIQAMHEVQDKSLLSLCYNNKSIDLIGLTCKYNNKKLLIYLLQQSHIMHYFTSDNRSKEIALYFAMRSNNFEILEMLYDYWTGDLHWLGHKKEYNEFDVENLNQLNNLLTNAFNKYEEHILEKKKVDQHMIFSIQSLMAFNDFQRDIYQRLNKLKSTLITWEDEPKDIIRKQETHAIRSMILVIFAMYENHSKKAETMIKNSVIQNTKFAEDIKDESTLMSNSYLNAIYEVYFRKLDNNICLLILDNLYLLKLRLSVPKNSYQKLENDLYHFYYHVSSKWSLYLSKRKKMGTVYVPGQYKNISCLIVLKYNEREIEKNSHIIIYLERRKFEKAIKSFEEVLQTTDIEENIRNDKIKLPNNDHNYLMLLPELRDDYSLKRMSQLIAQLYSIDDKDYTFLLIERTLQVVGEFLKSTDESLHLELSTEALLKAEISVEIINDLKTLRNILCHAKNGVLLKRIEIEINKSDILETIRKELLYVKKKIDEVINIHKPLVERALIRNAFSIIYERRHEMPDIVNRVYFIMLTDLSYVRNNCMRKIITESFYKEHWAPKGYSKYLMQEIIILGQNIMKLQPKSDKSDKKIHSNIIRKFPFYREVIKNSLRKITVYKEKWQQIVKAIKDKDPSTDLLDYPNEKNANKIQSYIKKFGQNDEYFHWNVEDNALFAYIENHWKFIVNLLEFIVIKTSIFNDTIEELKFSIYTNGLQRLKIFNYKIDDVHPIVTKFLESIEKRLKINPVTKQYFPENSPNFSGIRELTYMVSKPNFLTMKEKIFLVDKLQSISTNSKHKQYTAVQKMIKNIDNDIPIPMRQCTNFIAALKLDSNAQKILMNLVMGRKRDPLLLHCLSNRISLLKEVATNLNVNQLVLRYKLDKTFRVLLEILLFDIFDILEGNNKNTEIVKKSSKLLMEINLRNILTHGSPLLEVVGVVLDSNDLPTELVTKAVEFIKDETSIDALRALNDSGFFAQGNSNAISLEQEAWMVRFKTSPRWKDYIRLVPEYKRNVYDKQKNNLVEKSIKNCVDKKDCLLAQKSIEEGVDVNLIDSHKKAAIHYAAMKGDMHVMKILVNNGANVNIQNEENHLTALHYSVMKNFKDAVEFLLQNKADCLALDSKGRTPVYLANQRNFLNISQILLREMKKYQNMI